MLDRINKDFIFSPVNYVSRVQNLFDLKDKKTCLYGRTDFKNILSIEVNYNDENAENLMKVKSLNTILVLMLSKPKILALS